MRALSHIRLSVTAATVLILSGCSISPTVDAVSWTVDGVSYIVTGKGMMDHTLSAASGKDCAMMRVAKGQSPCLPTDAQVAGDRLVFSIDDPVTDDAAATFAEGGDPLPVNGSIAGLVEPLGAAVHISKRSLAIAAVAADDRLFPAPVGTEPSARSKSKFSPQATSMDRATRLWLPVDTTEDTASF